MVQIGTHKDTEIYTGHAKEVRSMLHEATNNLSQTQRVLFLSIIISMFYNRATKEDVAFIREELNFWRGKGKS